MWLNLTTPNHLNINSLMKNLVDVGSRTKLFAQDIVFLEASSNYTLLYLADGQKLVVSYHLGKLHERLLGCNFFIRPNRNIIVNMHFLMSYTADSLHINQRTINISRRRKEMIFEHIKNSLNQKFKYTAKT